MGGSKRGQDDTNKQNDKKSKRKKNHSGSKDREKGKKKNDNRNKELGSDSKCRWHPNASDIWRDYNTNPRSENFPQEAMDAWRQKNGESQGSNIYRSRAHQNYNSDYNRNNDPNRRVNFNDDRSCGWQQREVNYHKYGHGHHPRTNGGNGDYQQYGNYNNSYLTELPPPPSSSPCPPTITSTPRYSSGYGPGYSNGGYPNQRTKWTILTIVP